MPLTYWVEALHMPIHLPNILPSTSIQNDKTHFRLFQTHPTYTHLRVFGSLCYPRLTTLHKLSPRSSPCVLLGYPSNNHDYRCIDISSRKIIISLHVIFYETIFSFKSVTPNAPPSYDFLDTIPTSSSSFKFNDYLQPYQKLISTTRTPSSSYPSSSSSPFDQSMVSPSSSSPSSNTVPHCNTRYHVFLILVLYVIKLLQMTSL